MTGRGSAFLFAMNHAPRQTEIACQNYAVAFALALELARSFHLILTGIFG